MNKKSSGGGIDNDIFAGYNPQEGQLGMEIFITTGMDPFP